MNPINLQQQFSDCPINPQKGLQMFYNINPSQNAQQPTQLQKQIEMYQQSNSIASKPVQNQDCDESISQIQFPIFQNEENSSPEIFFDDFSQQILPKNPIQKQKSCSDEHHQFESLNSTTCHFQLDTDESAHFSLFDEKENQEESQLQQSSFINDDFSNQQYLSSENLSNIHDENISQIKLPNNEIPIIFEQEEEDEDIFASYNNKQQQQKQSDVKENTFLEQLQKSRMEIEIKIQSQKAQISQQQQCQQVQQQQQKQKRQSNITLQTETKNLVKNIGTPLLEHLLKHFRKIKGQEKLCQQLKRIKKMKKIQDIQFLFKLSEDVQKQSIFLLQQLVKYIASSKRIKNKKAHMKYIDIFIRAAIDPENFKTFKPVNSEI